MIMWVCGLCIHNYKPQRWLCWHPKTFTSVRSVQKNIICKNNLFVIFKSQKIWTRNKFIWQFGGLLLPLFTSSSEFRNRIHCYNLEAWNFLWHVQLFNIVPNFQPNGKKYESIILAFLSLLAFFNFLGHISIPHFYFYFYFSLDC